MEALSLSFSADIPTARNNHTAWARFCFMRHLLRLGSYVLHYIVQRDVSEPCAELFDQKWHWVMETAFHAMGLRSGLLGQYPGSWERWPMSGQPGHCTQPNDVTSLPG